MSGQAVGQATPAGPMRRRRFELAHAKACASNGEQVLHLAPIALLFIAIYSNFPYFNGLSQVVVILHVSNYLFGLFFTLFNLLIFYGFSIDCVPKLLTSMDWLEMFNINSAINNH